MDVSCRASTKSNTYQPVFSKVPSFSRTNSTIWSGKLIFWIKKKTVKADTFNPSRESKKILVEFVENFVAFENQCISLELEHSPQPHPQILGGVANYGIKLWGTNAAFFVPQGPAPGVGPAPPPSAAAPPGVHAQVAQNGTVYYHQPVRPQNPDYFHVETTVGRAMYSKVGVVFSNSFCKEFWQVTTAPPPFSRTDINNKCGKKTVGFTAPLPRERTIKRSSSYSNTRAAVTIYSSCRSILLKRNNGRRHYNLRRTCCFFSGFSRVKKRGNSNLDCLV